jgi:hypothetical protein
MLDIYREECLFGGLRALGLGLCLRARDLRLCLVSSFFDFVTFSSSELESRFLSFLCFFFLRSSRDSGSLSELSTLDEQERVIRIGGGTDGSTRRYSR